MENFIGYMVESILGMFKLLLPKEPITWELLGMTNKNGDTPKIVRTLNTPSGSQYVINPPQGMSIKDFINKQQEIENVLKAPIKIELAPNYYIIITELKARYEAVYKLDTNNLAQGMKFNIGKSLEGKEITLDLSGTECHTGVFGSTGSGKSVFLNSLITQMVLKDLELRLIDLKGGVEFGIYRDYKHLTHFAITPEEAESLLLDTVKVMNARYKELFEKRAKSYKDLYTMKPIIVLIDEFSVLDKKDNKVAHKCLFDLLSRGRACNICIILCTQRPSHEVVPGTIKCNLKNFISFKLENEIDSQVAIGGNEAYKLLKHSGEGLIKVCDKLQGFKSYYLTDSEIESLIKDKCKVKSESKGDKPTTNKQKKPIESCNRVKGNANQPLAVNDINDLLGAWKQ